MSSIVSKVEIFKSLVFDTTIKDKNWKSHGSWSRDKAFKGTVVNRSNTINRESLENTLTVPLLLTFFDKN